MPMPYSLMKGSILAVLDSLLNPSTPADVQRLETALTKLRAGDLLTSIGLVDSTNLAPNPGQDPLEERLNEYWFGSAEDGAGGWTPQAPYGPQNASTGYWVGYYGDVEGLLRETLIRAIEVSHGLDSGAAWSTGVRRWPVECYWKCPNPWVEGWVTWRRSGPNAADGQVTVIIATPADRFNRLNRHPTFPPGAGAGVPKPTVLPPDDHGMWLVTHTTHVPHYGFALVDVNDAFSIIDEYPDVISALNGQPAGVWAIPAPATIWQDTGAITVVPLPESAGGAAPFGRQYVP